ncbi:peptidase U32 family protein [Cohnella thailandensis]|uniref:U32 family peptidase n=1 Tax=Cohnella thailandensis TaxID=557557 RepID=A0A841T225_9BACL|nr:U32 family peptidase [Cohnella thailandensis]MBB6636120.1 U32 family peptidase [Cohnella thailandensis]MBP1973911.1 putative protease [Cohnella thailandensis]
MNGTIERTANGGKGKRYRLDKPELLAPAGSLEKLKIAVHYGADAVYIGGQKYGLRSNADNFSFEEMREGVEFAARYGAKVFVATNIYAHQEDLEGIEEYLRRLEEVGISAIIAADPIIVETAMRVAPGLEVHLSTQQSTMNWQAVDYWKQEGLPRVVLARETSMEEIREMKERVDIELEVFIHGAMCSSVSGRCVLSNHFTDRDSNRGGCCQSCRWKYDLHEGGVSVMEEGDNPFTMGSKDLCMIKHVPDLIEAGVDSFKIEGRMKSIHYVASVVNAYRQAIDSYMADPQRYELNPAWVEEIGKAANRPLNTGFFYSTPGAEEHIYEAEEKPAPYDFAALVLDYDESTGIATVQQRSPFRPGMEVEFFGPGGRSFKQKLGELTDEQGNPLDAARHPLQAIKLRTDHPVERLDLMRKRIM